MRRPTSTVTLSARFVRPRKTFATLLVGLGLLPGLGYSAGAVGSPVPPAKPGASQFDALREVPIPRPKAEKPKGGSPAAIKKTGNLVLRDNQPAKDYFGAIKGPAPLAARSIGSYAKGCLSGGAALPIDGPSWQVMRLSRNRNWGHPELISFMQDLATDAPRLGWRGLLVGDLAQPRGGPMTFGHSSHQIGLDADIWLTEMPNRRLSNDEREKITAISMLIGPMDVKGADRRVDPRKWTDTHARLIKQAASDKRVARIFVNPTIKKALCNFEKGRGHDRSWLRTVRPWWGHHYHFHVRLACPAGSKGCKNQNPPPPGDGCGKELTHWLSDEPWVPKKPKKKQKVVKKRHLKLAALPQACRQVLTAN